MHMGVYMHTGRPAAPAQHLDNVELVLGEDAGEAVGDLDQVCAGAVGVGALGQVGGAVDGGAHAEHAARLLGDRELVARDHFDADAQRVGLLVESGNSSTLGRPEASS